MKIEITKFSLGLTCSPKLFHFEHNHARLSKVVCSQQKIGSRACSFDELIRTEMLVQSGQFCFGGEWCRRHLCVLSRCHG